MAGAGVAVVADHAVGDEILRARRDVVQPHGAAQRFDRNDAQSRLALHSLAGDVALSRNRGIHAVEESQMLPQSAEQADDNDGLIDSEATGLDDELEIQCAQGLADPADDFQVGVGNAQDSAAIAALGIEDTGEKTGAPGSRRQVGPCDHLANPLNVQS